MLVIEQAEQHEELEIVIKQTEQHEEPKPTFEPEPDASVEPPLQEKKTERTNRSHIPFNVIMLNKDRQRLAQKSSIQAEKPEIPAPQKSEDPIVVPAVTTAVEEENEISYYQFPSANLLKPPVILEESADWIYRQEQMLNSTLKNFNVRARVVNVTQGPAVTRFEVQPEPGVKVNKVTNLSDDIKLSLAAQDIRMEAPIPGKHTIGIEVPNQKSMPVFLAGNSQQA